MCMENYACADIFVVALLRIFFMILRIMKVVLTKTIGLVLDFFNPRVLAGAHDYLEQYGFRLDARWSVRGDWTPEQPGWDGVIFGVIDNPELDERIQNWKIPKVSILPDHDESSRVDHDYEKCGMMVAQEQIELGVQSLLSVVGSDRNIDFLFARGVERVAVEQGMPYKKLELTKLKNNGYYKSIISAVESSKSPIGYCCPHAGFTYGVQQLLMERGIRVPEDVSMIVIDKDVQRTPELAMVPLTTLELNNWHLGFVAAEMIHQLVIGEIKPHDLPKKQILIPPKGVTRRASTGHEEKRDRVFSTAFNYVRKNFRSPIDVADVTSCAGVSRRVVEMRFRETLNRGVHEELTRLRIEEAKRQIMNKDRSITQIAEACGFSSVHYFSTAFKRETGFSPKQFQNQSLV